MRISGAYHLPVARERAYELLQDPAVLARCMPGTDRLERTGPDEYEMKMKMAIAAISGSFDGKIRIADQNPPESFRLIVEGAGKMGFIKGNGLLNLSAQPDNSSSIAYEGDVQAGGAIAAVGHRLLDSTARMIIKKFFEKLGETAAKGRFVSGS